MTDSKAAIKRKAPSRENVRCWLPMEDYLRPLADSLSMMSLLLHDASRIWYVNAESCSLICA